MYPWGNNTCDGLTTLCGALDIDSHSGVVNCCAFTHIMYALIHQNVITTTDILLKIRAPRRPVEIRRGIGIPERAVV
jgi:hypothetical protein